MTSLQREEAEHKAMFKGDSLASAFPATMNFVCMRGAIDPVFRHRCLRASTYVRLT